MGSNNAVTKESRTRRMEKNSQYTIDKSDDITIRRLLLDRLTPNYQTVENIMGRACPLTRTSQGRWELLLKQLENEKLIMVQWDNIPIFIEIKQIKKS